MTERKAEENAKVAANMEQIGKEVNAPRFRHGDREYCLLNDSIEVEIGGVLYRVKSIYNTEAFMGDVLDKLTMEQINRTTAA